MQNTTKWVHRLARLHAIRAKSIIASSKRQMGAADEKSHFRLPPYGRRGINELCSDSRPGTQGGSVPTPCHCSGSVGPKPLAPCISQIRTGTFTKTNQRPEGGTLSFLSTQPPLARPGHLLLPSYSAALQGFIVRIFLIWKLKLL